MTSPTSEPRLFIRPVGRIDDVSNMESILAAEKNGIPAITGELLLSVPVLPGDTLSDTKDIIMTMAEVRMPEGLMPRGALDPKMTETGQNYTKKDWEAALKLYCRSRADTEITDPSAARYDQDAERCPTNIIVQVIPIDNQSAALDLYMECLDRFEKGERDFSDLIPEGYLENDTAFRCVDGSLWSRVEAAVDSGMDVEGGENVSFRDLMNGTYDAPEYAPSHSREEVSMAPGA